MNVERFDEVEIVPVRRAIVTALPLRSDARERLASLLDARVTDIREAGDDADVVLTPSCSPQLIGALRRRFTRAQVIVVELDDWEFDVESAGPVKRILRSGAAAYVLADSIDELAAKLATRDDGEATPALRELAADATVEDLIAGFLRESVDHATRVRRDES